MRHGYWLHRLFVFLLVFSMSVGIVGIGRAQSDSEKRLYDDDKLFQQLSGAKQTLLELKFGKKRNPIGQTGVASPDLYSSMKQEKKGEIHGQAASISRDGSSHTQTGTPYSPNNNVDALTNNNVGSTGAAYFTQSEASLLAYGNRVVVAFNDAGSNAGGANRFTGYSYSADGGTTFTDGGSLPSSTGGDAGDPVLARNETTGRIYLATLGYSVSTIQVFRSDDDGVTWMSPVNGTPGGSSEDKEWIVVDNFSGPGNGNVYLISRRFGSPAGIYMFRSADNGATFGPSGGVLLVSGNQGAFVAVGPDHAVYAFWYAGTTLQMRKSTDQGLTFAAAVTVASGLVGGVNGDLGLTGIRQGVATASAFRSSEFPHAAVNPVSGNIYVTYNNDGAGADKADVYLVQSLNGGTTWGAPIKVNDDVTTTDQWQPTLAVLPDGSKLGIFYYSRQEDVAGNNSFKYYGRIGTISGSTVAFTDPGFAISDVASLPEFGRDAVINATYMGDYNHAVATSGAFHVIWSDNRNDLPSGSPRKDPNVYYETVPSVSTPAPALAFDSQTMSVGNGNGVVDPNECNNLDVTVKNVGTLTASGVTGTLTTSTPGATVTEFSSAYPNLAPGATGTNTIPFQITTTPSYVCGTPVALTLTLTYTGGSNIIITSLPSVGTGYTITTSTGASIDPGTTDIGNHGDDVVTAITLPFSYQYYGANFTTVNASSNGNLQFGSTSNAWTNICLPNPAMTDAVFPHWDDQRTDVTYPGKGIFTSTSGVVPNRIFNIEWRTVYYDNNAQNANYAIRLYEGQQKFDIIYGTMDQSGTSATAGCQQGTGSSSTQHECNTGGLSSGLMLTFTLSSCIDAGGAGCTPLPIQLASFTGSIVHDSRVRLDWVTLSELNNYGFEVQKALEQSGSFHTIPGSFIPGHGTTNEPHHYSFVDVAPQVRTLYYRLKQIDLDGSFHYSDPIRVDVVTGVEEKGLPAEFSLSQNYPNPFNPSTVIKYGLPVTSEVKMEVFNTLGQRVAVLVSEKQEAGYHTTTFENQTLSSGVYFYSLVAGQFKASKKLLLLR